MGVSEQGYTDIMKESEKSDRDSSPQGVATGGEGKWHPAFFDYDFYYFHVTTEQQSTLCSRSHNCLLCVIRNKKGNGYHLDTSPFNNPSLQVWYLPLSYSEHLCATGSIY